LTPILRSNRIIGKKQSEKSNQKDFNPSVAYKATKKRGVVECGDKSKEGPQLWISLRRIKRWSFY
jgi:hypothetical protein